MGKTMENKQPMTGNGKHTTYWNGDDYGTNLHCCWLNHHFLFSCSFTIYGIVLPTLNGLF